MCVLYAVLVLLYTDIITSGGAIEEIEWEDLKELDGSSTLCEKGWRQSPINIESNEAIKDFERVFIKYGHLKFYGYHSVLMTGVNDGQNIRYIADGDQSMRPRVTGGPLQRHYYLTEVTFRHLSEHALDGVKYPIEIQLVHIRDDLNRTTARHHRDGYAILSVFANVSEVKNVTQCRHPTDEIHDFLPELTRRGKLSGLVIDLRDILVPANGIYYTYMGSLTVPDCNEIVVWIIFKTPIVMEYESYSILSGEGRKPNSRGLGELRRHAVYRPHEPFFSTPVAVQNLVLAVTDMVDFVKEVSFIVDKGMNSPE